MTKAILPLIAIACVAGIVLVTIEEPRQQGPTLTSADVPIMKHTPQHLYMTSLDAYAFTTENPEILFIDVRDPVEIALHGHPDNIDAIVPIRIRSDVMDDALGEFSLVDNAKFLMEMDLLLSEHGLDRAHRIIVTCGSGRRSAVAATRLAEAGYTDVWHIVDGYVGEEKPGLNTQNAWELTGLPWSDEPVEWGGTWRVALRSES